ncbi:MAG: hypothetical protein ACOYB0_08300 [Polynucleobacter sp.]
MKNPANPIAVAVEPLRAAAVADAVKQTRAMIEQTWTAIEAANGNVNAAGYGYPRSGRHDYFIQLARCKLAQSVTESTSSMMDAPVIRDEARAESVLRRVAYDASIDFDAYVGKLTIKVGGEVAAAHLVGTTFAVWDYSILEVTHADGSVDRWKTTRIINCSKLGRLFNQYPTRKMK